MNLTNIIDKIQPEVCDRCYGVDVKNSFDGENVVLPHNICPSCNGTGYKHTVDEMIMYVIGDLCGAYNFNNCNYKLLKNRCPGLAEFISLEYHLSNAFIKIVKIGKMAGYEDFDSKEMTIRARWSKEKQVIKIIEYVVLNNPLFAFSAIVKFCESNNIDILKHVEERLTDV